MKTKKKWLALPLALLGTLAALTAVYFFSPRLIPVDWFGFARSVPEDEAALRMTLVDTA